MSSILPGPNTVPPRSVPTPPATSLYPASDRRFPERIRSFAFFMYRGGELYGAEAGEQAWADVLWSLADLAEDEEWTGPSPSDFPLPILNKYLRYTYQRLALEEKIKVSDDGEYAAFNTGLLTEHSEDIYGFFQKNRALNAQEWFFQRWATESDPGIMLHFPDPPQLAQYFPNVGDLVYDWKRELKFNFEHILNDNIDRFPEPLRGSPNLARAALVQAKDLALKRVQRDYKLIVPQWYPELGKDGSGFFMPLDLMDVGTTDLALVVSAVGDRYYRAHTVFTPEMAYASARLVARPDSGWLEPQAAALNDEDEE